MNPSPSVYPPDIILIRGAPGIGKTTLGEGLRKHFAEGAVIDVDQLRHMVNAEEFEFESDVHYTNAINVCCVLAKSLLAGGFRPIIITDVMAETFLNQIKEGLCGYSTFTLTLIASANVLMSRMRARQGGYINVEVANLVNNMIEGESHESGACIDTSHLSSHELRHLALKYIMKYSPGSTDSPNPQ